MSITWEQANQRLERAAGLLGRTDRAGVAGPLHAGVDLGTADIVLMVLDAAGEPVACFLEWAEVVRDGVVMDFMGAVSIVRDLISRARSRLGVELQAAATSFPPGTDARLSTNVLESAGLEVTAVRDEPSCVAALLRLENSAVVDVGGGTTGTAVVKNGRVVFSGDEPSGGRHITLTIAGHFDIDLAQAEERKRRPAEFGIIELARPTLQRISDIVAAHIAGHGVDEIILTGGTCCLPGVEEVFGRELGLPVRLPAQPLLLTPLAIAALPLA